MKKWLRRIRGAVGMGLTWGAAWWLVGLVIEVIHNVWPNPLGSRFDIWPAVLGYPAFFGGLVFSMVLAIAGRRRSFDELSLPRFAAWGAVAGLVVSLIPAAVWGAVNITLTIGGPLILLSAASASGSLMIARMAEDHPGTH